MRSCKLLVALAVTGGALGLTAASFADDPAARGLDVWLHGPRTGAPGAVIPVEIIAVGYHNVSQFAPLPGASVELRWDPTTLGSGVSVEPPAVHATTDAAGNAHAEIRLPAGPEKGLGLLIGVRHGTHLRTRLAPVARGPSYEVDLHVADNKVVPGSWVSAWAVVRELASGRPSAGTPVHFLLQEAGTARWEQEARTDSTGVASARIRIPRTEEPTWTWTLQASAWGRSPESGQGSTTVQLVPRDESPGTPEFRAAWSTPCVSAGDTAEYRVSLRDSSGQPVSQHPVRVWVGSKGTEPPAGEEEWARVSTLRLTDFRGEVRGTQDAPTAVAPVVGTWLRVVARTSLDGVALVHEDKLDVARPTPSVDLLPERGNVRAGLTQRVLLRVRDGRYEPVEGADFSVVGDGLNATVTTDANGEGEFSWTPPRDVGARRFVGPCSGSVAAAVRIEPRTDTPHLWDHSDPIVVCLPVDREAPAILTADPVLPRAGQPVRVRLAGGGHRAWTVVGTAEKGGLSVTTRIDDGEQGGELTLPAEASGLWTLQAASMQTGAPALVAGGAVLVRPLVLPRLEARIAGGRAAPGGSVELDATLTDEHGRGVQGAISAVVLDLHGGGDIQGLWKLDTRRALCQAVGVEQDRCVHLLDAANSADPLRRAVLGSRTPALEGPDLDPGRDVRKELDLAFARVVRSLEGAVYESTESPERLRDARRKGPDGRWDFNPEIWTLVTAAMDPPPMTPGGEPFTLADAVEMDSQVTFDNVARRVTRLKLYRVLKQLRDFVAQQWLQPDEPALRDPSAIVRRLARQGPGAGTEEGWLLDPWGGTLEFVRSPGPHLPFLTFRGHELRSPGPDGRLGTADDVRSPFDRVLRPGSRYSDAAHEQEVVDALLDMQVADASVSAWESTLEAATGTELGRAANIRGGGTGVLGHGGGFGYGAGAGGIGTRRGSGVPLGPARWIPPVLTDARGRARIRIPLGDAETTWRVALVALPKQATPAVATVDIPVSQPVSVRVEAGRRWVQGDEGSVRITVRNRTSTDADVALQLGAAGAIRLSPSARAAARVRVAAGSSAEVLVGVRATQPGTASFRVHAAAAAGSDLLLHSWEVIPAAEQTQLSQMVWLDGTRSAELGLSLGQRRPAGSAKLRIERGLDAMARAALDSLDPDLLLSPAAVADALEAATLVHRWSLARAGESSLLSVRAQDIALRAHARLQGYREEVRDPREPAWLFVARRQLVPRGPKESGGECPAAKQSVSLDEKLSLLGVEPPPADGGVHACWDELVVETLADVEKSGDPMALARAILASLSLAHRQPQVPSLLARLREATHLQPTGFVRLPASQRDAREARSLVYAALLRAAIRGQDVGVPVGTLFAWLAVQRDATGGYGSPRATRAVLQTVLEMAPESKNDATVTWTRGERAQNLRIAASEVREVELGADSGPFQIGSQGAPMLAQLQQRVLRPWSALPDTAATPVRLDVTWPKDMRAGGSGRLRVSVSHQLGRPATIDARIPLPPGVELATKVEGVQMLQGVLALRRSMDASAVASVIELPIRFHLSGRFTAPEAWARLSEGSAERAVAPARPIEIR